jgi:hypothetical protein
MHGPKQILVTLLTPPKVSLKLLLENPKLLYSFGYYGSSSAILTFDNSQPLYGSFKMARYAKIEPAFCSSEAVCVKQVYWTNSAKKKVPCDGVKQITELVKELNTLSWAAVLHESVYELVNSWPQSSTLTKEKPSLIIPQSRFVSAAIAIVQSTSPQVASTAYLVEEFICTPTSPDAEVFSKLINNDQAITGLDGLSKSQRLLAKFLEFCQHAQYLTHGRLVYVSDYQGIYSF